jgi:hypothetical protein
MKKTLLSPIYVISLKPLTTSFLRRFGVNSFIVFVLMITMITPVQKLQSQVVYEHVSHRGIYEYLDEMANMGIISLNSLIRPYTRSYITDKLREVHSDRTLLNQRQSAQLDFYLTSFGLNREPDHRNFSLRRGDYFFEDPDFRIQVRPVMGINALSDVTAPSSPDLVRYHRHNGAEAWASIRKNWGIYGSLRDNYVNRNYMKPSHLVRETGGAYKESTGSVEYSEMRGGIVYGNQWLRLGLVKDHVEWGEHYFGANIFSPQTPSFAQVKLNIQPVEWFEFNYFHAWLTSGIIDSARSYTFTNAYGTRPRYVYREKYLAANMFTFKPWNHTHFSLGNSIIYADMSPHPGYLIPIVFFKSVDHTLNAISNRAGQNSQMFFSVSTRRIANTHLYATLFLDEIATTNIFKPDEHSNLFSIKSGFRLSNFPIDNLHFTFEYLRTNPLVYQHFTPSTTFESNDYNLGHYLRDNAEQTYVSVIYQPFSRFRSEVSYNYARKGPDYDALGGRRRGRPYMSEEQWRRSEFSLTAGYQLIYNAWTHLTYQYTRTGGADAHLYHPAALLGEKHLLSLQMYIGL